MLLPLFAHLDPYIRRICNFLILSLLRMVVAEKIGVILAGQVDFGRRRRAVETFLINE